MKIKEEVRYGNPQQVSKPMELSSRLGYRRRKIMKGSREIYTRIVKHQTSNADNSCYETEEQKRSARLTREDQSSTMEYKEHRVVNIYVRWKSFPPGLLECSHMNGVWLVYFVMMQC